MATGKLRAHVLFKIGQLCYTSTDTDTVKHYILNEQEHFRQSFEWGLPNAMSSNIDDRTLHELYLWPFADSVRVGVASVMCSYQMVNNSYVLRDLYMAVRGLTSAAMLAATASC